MSSSTAETEAGGKLHLPLAGRLFSTIVISLGCVSMTSYSGSPDISKTRPAGALRQRCFRKSPDSHCPLGGTTRKRCEATSRLWPHYFRTPILQRAAAARPPSSASWWAPSSSRGQSLTLSRQSKSSKAAWKPHCAWREFDLARLEKMVSG